jgi:hypothetical protein
MRQPKTAARNPTALPGAALAELARDLEQAMVEREHRHHDIFGDRGLVAEGIAQGQPGRQRRKVEKFDAGGDRLHQPDLRCRPVIGAPMVADENFGIGGGVRQPIAVDRIAEDLDREVRGQLRFDPRRRVGGDAAEKQRFAHPCSPPPNRVMVVRKPPSGAPSREVDARIDQHVGQIADELQ